MSRGIILRDSHSSLNGRLENEDRLNKLKKFDLKPSRLGLAVVRVDMNLLRR